MYANTRCWQFSFLIALLGGNLIFLLGLNTVTCPLLKMNPLSFYGAKLPLPFQGLSFHFSSGKFGGAYTHKISYEIFYFFKLLECILCLGFSHLRCEKTLFYTEKSEGFLNFSTKKNWETWRTTEKNPQGNNFLSYQLFLLQCWPNQSGHPRMGKGSTIPLANLAESGSSIENTTSRRVGKKSMRHHELRAMGPQ